MKSISVESGDVQTGFTTASLHEALVVRVLGENGEAVAGAMVRWTTRDGGALTPSESQTDQYGLARTLWTLGPTGGRQHARATVDGWTADFAADALIETGGMPAPLLLTLETPEGSGQTVHPDFVAMAGGWGASPRRYLLATPYPNSNTGFENPSIFAESGSLEWAAPVGGINPIATPTGGYLSDPDAVSVPETHELWVYYRAVQARNEIYLIRSKDGVQFTEPQLVASADNHDLVSPAVVRRGPTDWMMWSVKAGSGCSASSTSVELRRSTNGIDWSAPKQVSLSQGNGFFPWHIDVQWIPSRNEYWALFNGKMDGSCATPALFIATSPDGETWKTYPSPILVRGVSPDLADIVYRSTFNYDAAADEIEFWYSGASYQLEQFVWRTAYQRRTRGEVFAKAAKKSYGATAAIAPRPGIPPLLNPP